MLQKLPKIQMPSSCKQGMRTSMLLLMRCAATSNMKWKLILGVDQWISLNFHRKVSIKPTPWATYLKNSINIRLELLAGLIDSDGYIDSGGYGITLKDEKLSNQIVYLSRSLGFYTSIKKKVASMKRSDGSIYTCDVFKIGIFWNDLSVIPIKIGRK